MICFAQMGSLQKSLCFNSEVPLSFNTIEQCVYERDNLINYMHQDLVDRDVSILFVCKDTSTQKINI